MDGPAIRERLKKREQELRALIAASEESCRPVVLDQDAIGRLSRMDALQGQAMAIATRRQYQQEIQRIEAALKRLDDGEYGACVACGEDIALARLAVDPTIPTCIACASGADR